MEPVDVAALVRRVPGWETLEGSLTPIETGITNRNFRLDAGSRSYVIRIPGERTELLGIDRAGEVAAAHHAAELGIGPPIHAELPGVGTLVTEFVEGVGATAATITAPGVLEDVVGAVKQLHSAPRIDARFPIFRVVEWHARDAVANGVELPLVYADVAPVAARIEAAFEAAELESTPCHNDLLPANVLLGRDRLWIIDFEYAGMNHAMFDLANLAVNCDLDSAADERLLRAYHGDVSDRHLAQLQLMKIMSEMREGMWAVVQQAISTLTNVDFVEYATTRLEHCLALSAQPDVGRWLELANAS